MKNKFFSNLFGPMKATSEEASPGAVHSVAHGATGAAPSVPAVSAAQNVGFTQAQVDTAVKAAIDAERQRFRSLDALAKSFPGLEKQLDELRYSGADAGSAILALTEAREKRRLEAASAVNEEANEIPDLTPALSADVTASGDGEKEKAVADEKTLVETASAKAKKYL